MKLGELRAAVRSYKGAIRLDTKFAGKAVLIAAQKTPLLEMLKLFGTTKSDETGLILDADGILLVEDLAIPPRADFRSEDLEDALDDLLG